MLPLKQSSQAKFAAMYQLSRPPQGSRIQIHQTHQQVKITLPTNPTFSWLMGFALGWASFASGRSGLKAFQTEPFWTGAVIFPWMMALGLGTIALFLLVSKPVFYVDPPGKTGTFRLQWAVMALAVNQRSLQLQLFTPFRRQWVQIPVEQIRSIDQFDEQYTVLLRRQHDRLCILRGQHQDFLISSELTSTEQIWLGTELEELLKQLKQNDRRF